MFQFRVDQKMFWQREDSVAMSRQLSPNISDLSTYPQPDPNPQELKTILEDLMMKFITTQMATNELLKENLLRQDDTIRQLGREVERLTELIVVMKSTNQPPYAPKVIPEVVDSDDSNDDLLLQDELYQDEERTLQE